MSKDHTKEIDYNDYVEYHKKHELKRGLRKWDDSDSWYGGTRDLKHTYKLATKGWDSGLRLLTNDDKINVDGATYAVHSVAGASVDIGQYINGSPESMLTFIDEANRDKPELTIYVDLAYNSGFHEREAMQYTMSILDMVNKIQADYDVRLIGVFTLEANNGNSNLFINIKHLDERFVLNKIAFSFHPSFFRRLWHYYLNCTKLATGGGAKLRSRNNVTSEIQKFHDKNYVGYEAWVLPSLQHHGEDIKEEHVTKINAYACL